MQNFTAWLLFGVLTPGITLPVISQEKKAQAVREAYADLVKQMNVRETGSLMFAEYNDVNLKKLERFLQQFKQGVEREKILYLRAHMIWSLHRYDKAPAAYADYLKDYPQGRFSRISRLRKGAGYLFAGHPDKALPILEKLSQDFPDRPEMYGRELAYSYSRCGQQKKALSFMDSVENQMRIDGKERLLPRLQSHFDVIRLVGKPLPRFEVTDHRNQETIAPNTLKGKVVLIDFWATWCKPCVADLPHLERAHAELRKKGFELFSVSLDEDPARLDRLIETRNLDWHHFNDQKKWSNHLAATFGVHSIPANFLIDRKGIIRSVNLRGPAVKHEAEKLLSE